MKIFKPRKTREAKAIPASPQKKIIDSVKKFVARKKAAK